MTSLSKSFRLSSTLKIEEEYSMVITKNQGISSILIPSNTCDDETSSTKSSSSLRRTLSADMSSTKWLTHHGFSPMKKIASSEQFSISSITDSPSSSDDEEEQEDEFNRSQFDIWNSIQDEVAKKKEAADQFDTWSSIIQQKSSQDIAENKPLSPPYIHPLVKRSSSLSEKSLEICTENLGSETGSDGFSSYPASESGDATDDDQEQQHQHQQETVLEQEQEQEQSFSSEAMSIPKYNYSAAGKKSPARPFPPPIPSRRDGASSIRMQSRRDNGRLVLEAVSVPSTNNFLAQRQDGRLVLTLLNTTTITTTNNNKEQEEEGQRREVEEELDDEELDENFDDDDEEEEAFEMEEAPAKKLVSSRVINVHRLSALMGLAAANRHNPSWPNKFNEVVKFDDDVDEEDDDDFKPTILAKSLPPMPRMIPNSRAVTETAAAAAAAAASGGVSFNAYEYYWRPKPMTADQISKGNNMMNNVNSSSNSNSSSKGNYYNNKLVLSKNTTGNKNYNKEQQQLLVFRGNKGDYLVPLVKTCKEQRRSLLAWEPYCIATS